MPASRHGTRGALPARGHVDRRGAAGREGERGECAGGTATGREDQAGGAGGTLPQGGDVAAGCRGGKAKVIDESHFPIVLLQLCYIFNGRCVEAVKIEVQASVMRDFECLERRDRERQQLVTKLHQNLAEKEREAKEKAMRLREAQEIIQRLQAQIQART